MIPPYSLVGLAPGDEKLVIIYALRVICDYDYELRYLIFICGTGGT